MGPAVINTRYAIFGGERLNRLRRVDFGDLFALAYLVFFVLEPLARHSTRYWIECAPLLAGFLVLWFSFLCSHTAPTKRWIVLAVVALGTVTMPLNEGGGVCFLIYAISLIPYAVTAVPWQLGLMGADLLLIYGEERWRHFPPSAMFFTLFFAMAGGGANLFFAEKERSNGKLRLKQEEIEALAAVAERERIARDLHDVLGHTLSVIVLKSELAGRLVERECDTLTTSGAGCTDGMLRARAELADVERTARTALAEVREAITGYRARGLRAEIDAARTTLSVAGVELRVESNIQELSFSAGEETILALALREAATNIVRHARATECRLALVQGHGRYRFSVADNGHHTAAHEGNGLRGMRERVESLGGQLSIEREAGTRLLIDLPSGVSAMPRQPHLHSASAVGV